MQMGKVLSITIGRIKSAALNKIWKLKHTQKYYGEIQSWNITMKWTLIITHLNSNNHNFTSAVKTVPKLHDFATLNAPGRYATIVIVHILLFLIYLSRHLLYWLFKRLCFATTSAWLKSVKFIV